MTSDTLLSYELSAKMADLYNRMEKVYDDVARKIDFSCAGCPDNCCDSFFLHHTYVEWAYLWEGLHLLDKARLDEIRLRAGEYVAGSEKILSQGARPVIMCPLNESGRCSLYLHRLMICRMHGVPSEITMPNGRKMHFPGCFRCQELVGEQADCWVVDRTGLYKELVALETEFLGAKRAVMPKVKMTIAGMIVLGPPG
ncbi:MAG: hypothetical protein KKB30_04535 [Proteobacteria bacterium]|nr:hypothetical protein [Pseudomonadota bacterium]MBU1715523.1 hypothetical protein [Pseudomonadota bacterium]